MLGRPFPTIDLRESASPTDVELQSAIDYVTKNKSLQSGLQLEFNPGGFDAFNRFGQRLSQPGAAMPLAALPPWRGLETKFAMADLRSIRGPNGDDDFFVVIISGRSEYPHLVKRKFFDRLP